MGDLWLNVIAGGVLMGVVYALIAAGLTILFGVMRIVNFAHGEMVVTGMYLGYVAQERLGLPTLPAAALAAAVMFVLGYALQILLVNRFIAKPQHAQFILFIGLGLVITGLHLILFGPDVRSVQSPLSFESFTLGPLRLDGVRLQAALAAGALILALAAFLRFSSFGQAIRAAADNRVGALAIGLRLPVVFAVTAGVGLACAGAAGALVSPLFDAQPFLAVEFTLLAFITVIVGGLGSLTGALVGGVLIGVTEAAATLLINPSLKSTLSYALLIAVLLVRPQGILGPRTS